MPRIKRSFKSDKVREMMRETMEEYERDAPKRKAQEAQQQAEATLRASLHPTERLAEDGAKLRQVIDSNDDMLAVLEVSRSTEARCRAGSDCFYAPRIEIENELRIRVEGVRGERKYYRAENYYHVRGRIDLDVLMDYVEDRKEWERGRGDGVARGVVKGVFAGRERKDEAETTAVVPETSVASREEDEPPVLRDYVVDEPWVGLTHFVQLPEMWEGQMQFVLGRAVDPWADDLEKLGAEEYGPKTEEEVGREVKRDRKRLDEKRKVLREIWDKWHARAVEVSEDDVNQAEGRKRSRGCSDVGEEGEDKRQKVQGDGGAEGEK